jgi:hypothetical protein
MEGTERGPVEADGSPAIEVHRRGCASSCTLSSPGTTVGTIKGSLGVPGSESPYVLSSRGVHVGAAQSLSSVSSRHDFQGSYSGHSDGHYRAALSINSRTEDVGRIRISQLLRAQAAGCRAALLPHANDCSWAGCNGGAVLKSIGLSLCIGRWRGPLHGRHGKSAELVTPPLLPPPPPPPLQVRYLRCRQHRSRRVYMASTWRLHGHLARGMIVWAADSCKRSCTVPYFGPCLLQSMMCTVAV